MLTHAVRNIKLSILRPTIVALGQTNLLLSERLAVRCTGIVLMRSAVRNVALDDDERRGVGCAAEIVDRLCELCRVVGVSNAPHPPAIREKARGDIFAERKAGVTFDSYVIIVVDPAQVAELLVTGKRGRLARHALHHIAITA